MSGDAISRQGKLLTEKEAPVVISITYYKEERFDKVKFLVFFKNYHSIYVIKCIEE